MYQAYSRLYDLAPSPPPPAFHVSKLDRRHTGRLKKRDNLLKGEKVNIGRECANRSRESVNRLVTYSMRVSIRL
jgi:hypothetical protein